MFSTDIFASGVFIADLFGFILALPISLFLAFWMSAVKNRMAVVAGAFFGALIAFFILLFWAGNMTNPTANPAAVFFGSLLFCAALALIGGIGIDLLVGRISSRDYRRDVAHEA